MPAIAEYNCRFEWQLSEKFSTELFSRSRFANDKRTGSAHIHDIVVAQFFRENARAKRPVSANIDASEENNESHSGIVEKRVRLRQLRMVGNNLSNS